MLATDEDAVICDFAETYGVYNLRALPLRYAATLAFGLRQNSRIKTILAGMRVPLETLLYAIIADNLRLLVWQNTADGHKGNNPPRSIAALLNSANEKQETEDVPGFDSGADFAAVWNRINNEKGGE